RNKGQMEAVTKQARAGEARILIGTQMLAKGHHFPKVTLVALLDIDQGLFSCDFRAAERMAQLVIQVAGRSGRAQKQGQVVIQTYHPDHPLLETLVTEGYDAFARQALEGRRLAELPPYSFQIMLRAESIDPHSAWQFLLDIQSALYQQAEPAQVAQASLEALGPVSAPMLRKQGRFRYQLLLQANQRGILHHWLGSLESRIYAHPLSQKVRWSIDVDPQEMA
ncbi:MAG: helicase-related protein, partial [Hydrogenovibrio sp.]|nr:helicase-related protein [Hydrogenovibrio sp.]